MGCSALHADQSFATSGTRRREPGARGDPFHPIFVDGLSCPEPRRIMTKKLKDDIPLVMSHGFLQSVELLAFDGLTLSTCDLFVLHFAA